MKHSADYLHSMSTVPRSFPACTLGPESRSALVTEASGIAVRLGFAGSGTVAGFRSLLILLVFILTLGGWVPLAKGVGFLDPVVLGSYACLGVMLAAPLSVTPGSLRRPKFTHLAARIAISVGYGNAISILLLAGGIICVYATHVVVVGPDLMSLGSCLLFGLTLSIAVSTAVVWTTASVSGSAAKMVARGTFMGLVLTFFEWSSNLPDVALIGSAMAGTLAAGMLWGLRQRFRNDDRHGQSAVQRLQ